MINGCQEFTERRNKQNTEDFQDSENTLYNTTVMNTGYYRFVQTHGMYNTKSES